MGRSQRHKVIVQGTDSAGKGLSEKQPAIVYIQQYAASQAFTVPLGPPSGPLKGSSLAGYPPTLIPPPGLLATYDAELTAEGEFTEPGQFNLSGNPIHADLPAPEEGGGGILPPPDRPTLVSIEPASGEVGTTTPVTIMGVGFTETSTVEQDGNDILSTFVADDQIDATIPGSIDTPGTVQITVTNEHGTSNAFPFEVTEAAAPPEAPPETPIEESQQTDFPYGPYNLIQVEDIGDTLRLHIGERIVVAPGNIIVVEATGTTAVNGSYEVKTVAFGAAGTVIVVDNPGVDLPAPIDNRGRLTVIGAA